MKNTFRYSTEPSAVTMIIGVAVTLLGIGLAVRSSAGLDHLDLISIGALVSAVGALTLGLAQTAKTVGTVSTVS